MARVASSLRHRGIPELVRPPDIPEATWLRALPVSLRPCEHQLIEAESGGARNLATRDLRRLLQELPSTQLPPNCRIGTARLFAEAGIVLIQRGRVAPGLSGLFRALRCDPLFVPRQLGAMFARRSIRISHRLRYLVAREPG